MKNQLFNKRIPTLLGIGLIALGILLTNIALENQTNFRSKASDSKEPQNIKITNISDRSFTITYQTIDPTVGSVSYGPDMKMEKSEIESANNSYASPKRIHSISVEELSPATKYYLIVTSGPNTFSNNETPFEITTGPEISPVSTMEKAIKGKIVSPDGSVPPAALVYLSADNSQLLSTTITNDGSFSFSLKELRTNDLFSSYFTTSNNPIAKIVVTDGTLKSTTLVSLNQEDSIPTITLSNDYDFTQEIIDIASNSAESLGFPSTTPSSKNLKPELFNPKNDQIFTSQKPQFSGKSLPNETVEINIRSTEEISTRVTANNSGNWRYRPLINLSPGSYTITIKTRDSFGILTTIARSFSIITTEATQVPTPLVLSATSIQNSTPAPTILSSPKIAILMPTPTLAPTPPLDLPPTGSSQAQLIIGGVVATLMGIALLFFAYKTSL